MATVMSDTLKRKSWIKEGLKEATPKSFWTPLTGMSYDSIVFQHNDKSCGTGHTTTFDFDGILTGKQYKGQDYKYGKGEIKRKFSSTIVVDEYSLVVANGTRFESCEIDDLDNAEHGKSRAMLADLFMRHKDQRLFDVAQGCYGQTPTHIIKLGTAFDYNSLLIISDAAKTGKKMYAPNTQGAVGTTPAKKRVPMRSWNTIDGRDIFLSVIDDYMSTLLKSDAKYQTIVINADVRGNDNRSLSMVIGKLGNVYYRESPVFSGTTEGEGSFGAEDTELYSAGLRKYATKADGSVVWEGQVEYDKVYDKLYGGTAPAGEEAIYSRGLVLGSGAIQFAMGKEPDYKLLVPVEQEDTESKLNYWGEAQKTRLTLEKGKAYPSKFDGIDFSVLAVDIKHTIGGN